MKKKIHLGGAGGAPTNNIIRSLRESGDEYLIGTSCEPGDLFLADVDQRHCVPRATCPDYKNNLLKLLIQSKPDLAHFQNDFEIRAASRFREDIEAQGVKLYMPSKEVIENCVDKNLSYQIWKNAGLKVPRTILLHSAADLKLAFNNLGPKIWLRATEGGGGNGALPTEDYDFARLWIEKFDGWGKFTAAECLTPSTVTWLSIWHQGELVVAQTGGNVRVRLCIDIGVHPERYRRAGVHRTRNRIQTVEFRCGFDVEATDARCDRAAHFGFGLADAGEKCLLRIAVRLDHAREFSFGDDVESRAETGEHVQHREIRIGLDRVADERIPPRATCEEFPKARLERRARIHIAGRAEFPRD